MSGEAEAKLAVAKRLVEALMARKGPESTVRDVRIDADAHAAVFTTVAGTELELPIDDLIALYG